MQPIRIRSVDGPSVLYHGTVIAFDKRPIEFIIPATTPANELSIRVQLSDEEKLNMSSSLDAFNTLTIHLAGWKNPVGVGTIAPLQIGDIEIDGKKYVLHFAFRVYHLTGSDSATIHYTFYVSEPRPST